MGRAEKEREEKRERYELETEKESGLVISQIFSCVTKPSYIG